ncbi:MAG: glycosyltransferase family 2 protein [Actinobacteria bacterium]|nr:glycosyltransferase family 2 protein [Actinomycetota bacterium]
MNKENLNKIAIIIPAYNEEKYIEETVKRCLEVLPDVVVIDDGSSDLTNSIAKKVGALVLKHKVNKGKGVALRTAFNFALENGFSGIITIDADHQHNVDEIQKFINFLSSSKEDVDIILGNRMKNPENMPWIRYVANKFTSWLISKRSNTRIPDVQSGFRYISRKVLKNIKTKSNRFEAEPELLLRASLKGYKIVSIPVSTIYYKNAISYVHPIKDALMFLKMFVQSFLWKTNSHDIDEQSQSK